MQYRQSGSGLARWCAIVWVSIVAGCGGGGGSSTPAGGLTVSTTSLAFEVEEGQDDVAPKEISGSLTGVTEPTTVIIAYTSSGIESASFVPTSATSGTLVVQPRSWLQLGPGSYADTITVQACLDVACTRQAPGSPQQVAVRYVVRAARAPASLQLSDRAVALAAVPEGQRLTATLTVTDTASAGGTWTAASSAAWLSVTASGASGGALQLSAQPAGLPDGLHMATVTVTSANPAITQPVTAQVGLYKSGAASVARLAQPLSAPDPFLLPGPLAVSDPARPRIYMARGNELAGFDVYTGERTGSLILPGAEIRDLAVSDDASRLYLLDHGTLGIVVVDLASFSVSRQYVLADVRAVGNGLRTTRMAFARVGGQPVLVLSQAQLPTPSPIPMMPVLDAESGRLLGRVHGLVPWDYTRLAATRGPVLFTGEKGLTGGLTNARIDLQANSTGSVFGRASILSTTMAATSMSDIAGSPDGSRLLAGFYNETAPRVAQFSGSRFDWTSASPADPFAGGMAHGDIEFLADGRHIVFDGIGELRLYDASGARVGRWTTTPPEWLTPVDGDRLRVSADGLRVLGGDALFTLVP